MPPKSIWPESLGSWVNGMGPLKSIRPDELVNGLMGYWVGALAGACFEPYVVFRNARKPIPHYRLDIT